MTKTNKGKKKKITLKRRLLLRKKRSTRKLLDILAITECSLETYGRGEIAYLSLRPTNLSVLTPENLTARVNALMNVLKGVANITMLCLNSRENFGDNKRYLRNRIELENNPLVRELLRKDIEFLDEEQTSIATAREFFLLLRLPKEESRLELLPYIHKVEQTVREQGFMVKLAQPEDLKRILAVYLEQNVTSDRLEDLDGERFVLAN